MFSFIIFMTGQIIDSENLITVPRKKRFFKILIYLPADINVKELIPIKMILFLVNKLEVK